MEQDYITIYQDQPAKPTFSPRIVAIIAGVVVVVIIVIVILVNLISSFFTTPSNFVKITNYADLPVNPPSYIEKDLTAKVSELLSSHFDLSGVRQVEATIRSGSYQDTSSDQISSASFILDVDAYQQSYEVSVGWSDTVILSDDILLECTTKDNSKYPDAKCYSLGYDSNSPYPYLPYESNLLSGQSFTATYGFQDNSGFEHLTITVQDCGDSSVKEKAVDAVKDYLKSTANLDPEDYIYQKVSDNTNCN